MGVEQKVKAFGACSGGMDGLLAAALLREQGISVELVTFSSPFFSAGSGRDSAVELGVPWHEIDITEDMIELLRDPPSGFGKNCNPCIDCHALMFRKLGDLASERGGDLIFSGEVLGQRPMSQNRGSLNRVSRLSGYRDILLRPLSAKLLPETVPEQEGLVDREKLLDISGRGRKRQAELAERWGLRKRQAGGGCLLTDPIYSNRLRLLLERPELLTPGNCRLIASGRVFRLPGEGIGVVGRSRSDNEAIRRLASGNQELVELRDGAGPLGVLLTGGEDALTTLCSLVASYVRGIPSGEACTLRTRGGRNLKAPAGSEKLRDSLIV